MLVFIYLTHQMYFVYDVDLIFKKRKNNTFNQDSCHACRQDCLVLVLV